MNPSSIIAKKRDGMPLSRDELESMVDGYVAGRIPDYQMSALIMAIYLNGMDADETAALTELMLNSGTSLPRHGPQLRVDKHSTGGIGDKVSLILAPLLACCGLQVPMISGRGLGPTGGTLDKLESISGFRTDLTVEQITKQVEQIGCVITGATADLVPADRKLYSLRDATATVASIPLITASIISKKVAEQLDALVLDVKTGSGAFKRSVEEAQVLARSMVDVGNAMGMKTTTLITDMNQPLGRMAGNSVEVIEAIDTFVGNGPDDLLNVALRLGAELLVATEIEESLDAAEHRLKSYIDSGAAKKKFDDMVRAQGGDLSKELKVAPEHEVSCISSGYVKSVDAEVIGMAIIEMGGGRKQMNDSIDHSVGIETVVRIGEKVHAGEPIFRVYAADDSFRRVETMLQNAVEISENATTRPPLIIDRVA